MYDNYVVNYLDALFGIIYNYKNKNISIEEVYSKIDELNLNNLPENLRYMFSEVINSYLKLAEYIDRNRKNYKKDAIKGFLFAIFHIWGCKELFKFMNSHYKINEDYSEKLYKYLGIIKDKYITKEIFFNILEKYKYNKFQKSVLDSAWDNNFSCYVQ